MADSEQQLEQDGTDPQIATTDRDAIQVLTSEGLETSDTVTVEKPVVTDEMDAREPLDANDVRTTEAAEQTEKREADAEETAAKREQDAEDTAAKREQDGQRENDKGRFLEDGRYEVTRADGTKLLLERDELPSRRFQGRRWYEELTSRVDQLTAENRALREEQQKEFEQTRSFRERIEEQNRQQEIEEKPWLAEGADAPTADDFETLEEWADARDEWKRAQDSAKEAPGDQPPPDTGGIDPEALAAVNARLTEIIAEGAERFEDFETTVTQNAEAPFNLHVSSFLAAEAEDPAAAFHYLGTHVNEAAKIADLLEAGDGRGAIRALARAEASIHASRSTADTGKTETGTSSDGADNAVVNAEKPSPRKRASQAPEPITPIDGAAATRVDPERESVSQYMERRRNEMMTG